MRRADDLVGDARRRRRRGSPAWNAFFTRRSSPEWNVRIATRPPGARQSRQRRAAARRAPRTRRSRRCAAPGTCGGPTSSRRSSSSRGSAGVSPARTSAIERRGSSGPAGAFSRPAMSAACGSSAFSASRSRELASSLTRASSCEAGSPRGGFIRMSSGPALLVAEAARRVVELHRRHAEVGENDVRGRERLRPRAPAAGRRSCAWRATNVSGPKPAARRRASVRGNSSGSTSRPISRPPGWMRSRIARAWPPPPSVQSTATSPGAGRRHSSTSAHHDRPMHAGRRLAGRDDLLHVGGIPLGVQLLVLLVEHARIRAPVARPAGAAGRRVS